MGTKTCDGVDVVVWMHPEVGESREGFGSSSARIRQGLAHIPQLAAAVDVCVVFPSQPCFLTRHLSSKLSSKLISQMEGLSPDNEQHPRTAA